MIYTKRGKDKVKAAETKPDKPLKRKKTVEEKVTTAINNYKNRGPARDRPAKPAKPAKPASPARQASPAKRARQAKGDVQKSFDSNFK